MRYLMIYYLSALLMAGCVSSPGFSDVPEIEFTALSSYSMNQGAVNDDSIAIFFNFKDGNGDIGDSDKANIVLTDNRTGEQFDKFRVPVIPLPGSSNGVEGEVRLLVLTTCCIFPDPIPPCSSPSQFPTNELSFDIYLVDRAGNQSNVITTPVIELVCN